MSTVDYIEITKVAGAGCFALIFSQANLSSLLSIGELLETILSLSVLTATFVYTIYKIKDVKKNPKKRNINH